MKSVISRAADLEMEAIWASQAERASNFLSLDVEIHSDIDVFDSWGYPIKGESSPVSLRRELGWSSDHIQKIRGKQKFPELKNIPSIAPSDARWDVLLSFPGIHNYGHWLVDVVPRIELVLKHFKQSDLAFIVPGPMLSWAWPFLNAYGITEQNVVEIGNEQRYFSRSLIIPSLNRVSDYLPAAIRQTAFRRLRTYSLDCIKFGEPHVRRILVRHSAQTSSGHRATLSNFDELQAALSLHGFKTIVPADMPRREQIDAFWAADIIVGESSSALHNIIYGRAGLKLVVINGIDEKNLLHLSISKLLEQECIYVFCQPYQPQSFSCNVGEVCNIVEDLEART